MDTGITASLVTLGWREWVELPALGTGPLRAKIDTGARSSALHVDMQWRFVQGGAPWVGFRLALGNRTPGATIPGDAIAANQTPGAQRPWIEAAAPVLDEREVSDSGGHRSRRVFLRTVLCVAGVEREIEINLCDRRRMLFPLLLGRTALAGAFVVDPARSLVHARTLDAGQDLQEPAE